ncbi:aspartate-proton symporter [Alicyclobacillus contaminans]|uniref:APC family permease n=1 Tax=Alicyclobacillus contaminans TaxID=392016 RepID=UPI0003F5C282|nr:APC family permease [Alicyclobacillus contaminans]GMA49569.1 aspartate-proton symporter [Alicyclobacillus contaminans]
MEGQGSFKKQLSLMDLTFLGIGSIVGSGWLFASAKVANTAGPAAWISWLIGAIAVILLGFVYAELGGSIPRAGGTVRYPVYSHGPLIGYLMGFASLIAFSSVAGIEVEAARQYLSGWWPGLTADPTSGHPTVLGWIIQVIFLAIFFLLNYWSVRVFGKANTVITAFKFIVPTLAIITLLTSFHGVNFSVKGFAPFGFTGIESAVSTAGIVFAFLGFQQAVGFSSEAKNPQRTVPLSIILAVLLSAALYILLQVSFIGAVPTKDLAGGWGTVKEQFSLPFRDIALAIGAGWLAWLITFDAIISPNGTGNIYLSATSRVVFGWARNGTFFRLFGKVDEKTGVPRAALWLSFFAAVFWTLPFPSWDAMVSVVSSATVLTYIVGPVSLHAFRFNAPNLERPFYLKGINIISPLAFIIASEIIYWTGWKTDSGLIGAMLVMFVLYLLFSKFVPKDQVSLSQQLKSTWWLIVYFVVMFLISYLGTFDGGKNVLSGPWDQIIVAVISLGAYYWGVKSALPKAVFDVEFVEGGDDVLLSDGGHPASV